MSLQQVIAHPIFSSFLYLDRVLLDSNLLIVNGKKQIKLCTIVFEIILIPTLDPNISTK